MTGWSSGPFICARSVLPGMLSRRSGRIVNLASAAGLGTLAGLSSYSVSKAALIRLTDDLAAETREFGVSVFAIHPGTLQTPMNEAFIRICGSSSPGPLSQPMFPKFAAFFRSYFDEGRDVPVAQPVRLVLLLASGRADALTGCYISVEDDVADLVRRAEEIQRDDLQMLRLHT